MALVIKFRDSESRSPGTAISAQGDSTTTVGPDDRRPAPLSFRAAAADWSCR